MPGASLVLEHARIGGALVLRNLQAPLSGATLADAEFVQFHPTAIDIGHDPAPLATEALRGDGAVLVNKAGHRFMTDLHPDAELAPRDIVARGVFAEVSAGRGAFLDCTKAVGSHFSTQFPTVYASCIAAGIDPVMQPIPVVPAVHYHMGGVAVDADGQRLIVNAKEQLVLRCGKASITLTQSGKVLIDGTYVLNRSSGVNRIKGGSVQLN